MKKIILLAALMLTLTSCGGNTEQKPAGTEASKTKEETVQETEAAKKEKKEYGIGETWDADGKFNLTITDVKTTEGRNEFDESNPAEVVIITYSYENIGFESEIQDLFLVPDKVIDESGSMANSYPAVENLNYAKETPPGAKMDNAQEAFGLNNESKNIKAIFEIYDDEGNKYKATFNVPVNK